MQMPGGNRATAAGILDTWQTFSNVAGQATERYILIMNDFTKKVNLRFAGLMTRRIGGD